MHCNSPICFDVSITRLIRFANKVDQPVDQPVSQPVDQLGGEGNGLDLTLKKRKKLANQVDLPAFLMEGSKGAREMINISKKRIATCVRAHYN